MLERRRRVAWLLKAIESLPPSQRDVFTLFELEGLPMAEVAQTVGCPTRTAYARLDNARAAVQSRLRRLQRQPCP